MKKFYVLPLYFMIMAATSLFFVTGCGSNSELVDEDKYLSDTEKKDLIKIYRAQLSNPELYILFTNLISRFGKKWKDKEYITKYEFIKNLPQGYCDKCDPKTFFPMTYEYEEI